ncbi:E3 ubiquitin-protein ligase RNF34a isoform X3 [Gasterosteus aculeatus]
MKAGASSMWASCCGLLNEVMGTGAVRGQQPGFGAGAGPFRFAPSAGYSTYPPSGSGTPGLVCKSCGQAFSVFRRKYICRDCKKSFCSLCSVLQENLRICATCHLLNATAFQRPLLMRLRVRDLRQYLLLRNIPTDTCREKEDLVDLVLCHQGIEEEEGLSTAQSASELSAFVASREEQLSRSDSSDTNQDIGDATSVSLLNMDASEHTLEHFRHDNVTRFSLPVCDVISTQRQPRETWNNNNKTQRGGDDCERDIYKPTYRSSVWKHFGFCKHGGVLNESVAVCRICRSKIKKHRNTTNLSGHLLRRRVIKQRRPSGPLAALPLQQQQQVQLCRHLGPRQHKTQHHSNNCQVYL